MSWPAWAPLAAAGWRIRWRESRRRVRYDDGMAGEAPAGGGLLEQHDVTALLASDADRDRLAAWVADLPRTGWPVLLALPPAGDVRACRIAGGRGGVRYTAHAGAGGRRRWEAALTLETPWRDPGTVRARSSVRVVSSVRVTTGSYPVCLLPGAWSASGRPLALMRMRLYTDGRVHLDLSAAIPVTAVHGDDLAPAVEAGLVLRLDVAGVGAIAIPGPAAPGSLVPDASERYTWRPESSAGVGAYAARCVAHPGAPLSLALSVPA